MSHIARRRLLQFLAGSAAGLAAGRARAELNPNLTNPWAFSLPGASLELFTGYSFPPCKVLEIFLRGGASVWGSFWYDTQEGDQTHDTTLTPADWEAITGIAAPVPGLPSNIAFPTTHAWSYGTIGQAAHPLFMGSQFTGYRKLSDHMRVIRVAHTLGAHELAIPFATTGTTIGRRGQCGLGAAITRRVCQVTGTQQNPSVHSIIFQTGRQTGDALAASYLAATGNHGAKYRPPVIPVGDTSFLEALDRTAEAGPSQTIDDLKTFYRDRYANILVPSGSSSPVRSLGFSEYSAALDMMVRHAADLRDMLVPFAGTGLFTPVAPQAYDNDNVTRAAIRTAIDLLVSGHQIEHAAVVDGGVLEDYDTHEPDGGKDGAARIHAGGIWNVCNALLSRTSAILDNNILVLIHSEFGRQEDGETSGTEHHAGGYTNVVIAPFLDPAFVGAADPDESNPPMALYNASMECPATFRSAYTPLDVHAAIAAVAGIEPDQEDMYADHADLGCVALSWAPYMVLGV